MQFMSSMWILGGITFHRVQKSNEYLFQRSLREKKLRGVIQKAFKRPKTQTKSKENNGFVCINIHGVQWQKGWLAFQHTLLGEMIIQCPSKNDVS